MRTLAGGRERPRLRHVAAPHRARVAGLPNGPRGKRRRRNGEGSGCRLCACPKNRNAKAMPMHHGLSPICAFHRRRNDSSAYHGLKRAVKVCTKRQSESIRCAWVLPGRTGSPQAMLRIADGAGFSLSRINKLRLAKSQNRGNHNTPVLDVQGVKARSLDRLLVQLTLAVQRFILIRASLGRHSVVLLLYTGYNGSL